MLRVTRKLAIMVQTQSMVRWSVYAALTAVLAFASWQLISTLRAKPLSELSSSTAPQVTPRKITDMRSAGRLFGDFAPKQSVATLQMAQAADIKLVGIVAADDPGDSMAIIEVNGEAKTYSIGAALPDGETLKAVTSNGITLANGQAEQDLALAQQQAPTDAVFATLPVVQVAGDGEIPSIPLPPAKPIPKIPVAQQMTALRQAALQVLADRARHAPPAPGQVSPN